MSIQNTTQTAYVMADANGQIGMYGAVPASMLEIQIPPAGARLVVGYGRPETHYVKDEAVIERPACPATLAGMTLVGLPSPSVITVDGVYHDCTDPTCDLSFSHAGTYTVTVKAFPYLDGSFEVTQA